MGAGPLARRVYVRAYRCVPRQAPGRIWNCCRQAEPKTVKNRVHLDVAPFAGDDQAAEVAALLAAGAAPADVGQGQVPWTVLADPEGSEFCVVSPR